jgi:fatty acid synthase
VLSSIGIHPDGIVGHSVGELGCAYADGTFTAEQTVLAAYWRGLCILESKLPLGAMAAIGKSTVVSSKHDHPLMFTPLWDTGKTVIFCHTLNVPLLSLFLFS